MLCPYSQNRVFLEFCPYRLFFRSQQGFLAQWVREDCADFNKSQLHCCTQPNSKQSKNDLKGDTQHLSPCLPHVYPGFVPTYLYGLSFVVTSLHHSRYSRVPVSELLHNQLLPVALWALECQWIWRMRCGYGSECCSLWVAGYGVCTMLEDGPLSPQFPHLTAAQLAQAAHIPCSRPPPQCSYLQPTASYPTYTVLISAAFG